MGLKYFNRYAVILIKKKAYLDWYLQLPDADKTLTLDDLNGDSSVYLLSKEDSDEDEDLHNYVEDNFEYLFELEMENECEDEARWEKNLTFDKFNQWFDYSLATMPVDLADSPFVFEEA